jgi:hypothetical protein
MNMDKHPIARVIWALIVMIIILAFTALVLYVTVYFGGRVAHLGKNIAVDGWNSYN